MPFDETRFAVLIEKPVVPPFARGHEGLRQLAFALRHPEIWRPGFRWNFSDVEVPVARSRLPIFVQRLIGSHCGTAGCAIGLGRALWPEFSEATTTDNRDATSTAQLFGITVREANDLFHSAVAYDKKLKDVMPDDVADAIDRLLARKRGG